MKRYTILKLVVAICAVFVCGILFLFADEQKMPFGGKEDVNFAHSTWTAIQGYQEWPMLSDFYPGKSPHGKVLRLYSNVVTINEKPYYVIVKDNFSGDNATVETVAESPDDHLVAVTVMVQREDGYDPDNNNWFWIKYNKDGTLDKNAKGLELAGRVAKGMDAGCISCHAKAKENDYIFSNDSR